MDKHSQTLYPTEHDVPQLEEEITEQRHPYLWEPNLRIKVTKCRTNIYFMVLRNTLLISFIDVAVHSNRTSQYSATQLPPRHLTSTKMLCFAGGGSCTVISYQIYSFRSLAASESSSFSPHYILLPAFCLNAIVWGHPETRPSYPIMLRLDSQGQRHSSDNHARWSWIAITVLYSLT